MADNLVLRFFVSTGSGLRSGAWRLWSNGNDIYVAPREVASDLKISLHASGQCNHAFTKTLESELGGPHNLPKGARRQDNWFCDRAPTTPNSIALRLGFPTTELRPLPPLAITDKPHLALPAPPPGQQLAVYVGFTRSGPVRTEGSEYGLIADHPLPDGSRVAVLTRILPVVPQLAEAISRRRKDTGNIWVLKTKRGQFTHNDPGARMIIPGKYGEETFATYTEAALYESAS
jgi:hypothetical protein